MSVSAEYFSAIFKVEVWAFAGDDGIIGEKFPF